MVKIIKKLIKKLISYVFDAEIFLLRNNPFEKKLAKIKKIIDSNLKIKALKSLKKKYPQEPEIYLELAIVKFKSGDLDFVNDYELYNNKRKSAFKKSNINYLNAEFIPPYIFTGSFGNSWAFMNLIYAKKLNLISDNKFFVSFDKEYKLTNPALFKYFENYLIIINKENNYHFKYLSNLLKLPIGNCLPMNNSCPALIFGSNYVIKEKIKQKKFHYFNLLAEHKEKGKDILTKMGLPNNAWYVTAHIREASTHNDGKKESYRTADIGDYYKSFKFIVDQGGYVFRMGDPSMQKLPQMKNVIDYANSEFKSDIMDIFLGATSKFLIGTSSGYWPVPAMFGVPVILSNTTNTSMYYGLGPDDIFLPRIIFRESKNGYKEKLTLKDLFTSPYSISYSNEFNDYIKKNNISWLPNTEEELFYATRLMFNKCNKKLSKPLKFEKQYKQITKECGKNYSKNEVISFALIPDEFFDLHPELLN